MSKVLDWNEYIDTAAQMASEGCVLIKNDNNTLPLRANETVSVFGRIAAHYYKSGTGSGGMVNVDRVIGIVDGLKERGYVRINDKLAQIYSDWENANPIEVGSGWGNDPWCQKEMPLSDEICAEAAENSDVAIVIIGRTAGEDKDCSNTEGSYRLTSIEEDMLRKVCSHFERVAVLLNVGGILDMSFVNTCKPGAVMYVWHGGMVGGLGVADVLSGVISPCGKLPDTIAYELSDYPSDANFGGDEYDLYAEDIFVGYRYFETFAPQKVQYGFGYGLSYTTFQHEIVQALMKEDSVEIKVRVSNTGATSGKEVVMLYAAAPFGKLGKAKRELVCFEKTETLAPEQCEIVTLSCQLSDIASYDDCGDSGHINCKVLEAGRYEFYVGNDVTKVQFAYEYYLADTVVIKECEEALAPVREYKRFRAKEKDGKAVLAYEETPLATVDMEERRLARLPKEIPYSGDKGIMLSSVLAGTNSMDDFIAQLSDEDLVNIIRGEGMGSYRVTAGTAAAFGGVNEHLCSLGVPSVCCDDGPSGMRLDSGAKAFAIPIGTLIASSFNCKLTEKLYELLGREMSFNKVDCLLGPGINIHRHPLNGRNFEYFSEDPYLTGAMARSELRGLTKCDVTGTIKHFCGNNQEKRRHFIDSVISQRALREIYLRPFEMVVKDGLVTTIMTTYGKVNGLWTAGSYDLNTTILREDWGFKGLVMSDWWAMINERGGDGSLSNFARMAKAQNDVYMVCPDSTRNLHHDNTSEQLENGLLTRAELQRNAANICYAAMKSNAMKRAMNTDEKIDIVNRPKETSLEDILDLEFKPFEDGIELRLDDKDSVLDADYAWAFVFEEGGEYEFALTGSSELSSLAQIPCTMFFSGIPMAVFTFNGSAGEDRTVIKLCKQPQRFLTLRIHVNANGVKLKSLVITRKSSFSMEDWIEETR